MQPFRRRRPLRTMCPRRHQPRRLAGIEALERREVMAGNLLGGLASGVTITSTNPTPLSDNAIGVQPSPFRVSAYLSGRTLRIEGTDAVDNIVVREVDNILSVEGARIINNGRSFASIHTGLVDKVEVRGYKGGDTIDLVMLSKPSEVWAGEGGDSVSGGMGPDVVHGGSGDDWIWGNMSADRLYGDGNLDRIWGGSENDSIFGGGGNDILHGGIDHDWIYGEGGQDELNGDEGNDFLFGGEGLNDTLFGGDDNDWLEAGMRFERADGGNGKDFNAHEWAINGYSPTDVEQAWTGTCAFLSSLAAATKFHDLSDRITYEGNFTYAVWLYDDAGGWTQERVRFDGSMRTAVGLLFDPRPTGEGEFWTIVYQRAYLQRFEGWNDSNWILTAWFGGETPHRPFMAILGASAAAYQTSSLTPERLQSLAAAGPATACDDEHCYMVDEVYQDESGAWFVVLYNPWGKDESHEGALGVEPEPLTFTGTNEGYITVRWDAFKNNLTSVVTA